MGLLSVLGTIGGSLIPGLGSVGGAIGGALGGLIEGNSAANAAQSAADTTAAATNESNALKREMFNRQLQLNEPWQRAGEQALNKLIPLSMEYTPFGMQQFQADPGYGFRMSEGMKALERSAAFRGGLLSGSTLKGAQRFGQDLASQEYTNAFNRYQAERDARLGPLQSLARVGQTSAQQTGQAGQDMATSVGNAMINQGYTAGNAGIAAADARESAYANLGTALGQYPWQPRSTSMFDDSWAYSNART